MIRRVRITGALAGCLAIVLALSACSSGGKDKGAFAKLDRDDKGSLKVAFFNEQAFYMQYGNAYQAMFPNVEVEVVSTESVFRADDQVAAMEELLDREQPDVAYLNETQYTALSKHGKLYDLDPVIKQEEFDIDSFQPAVIELLRAKGEGKLNGLTPTFSSQALYYNKDAFDQHGIPYPTDGMSWDEVLKLAARFPAVKEGDDSYYGLTQPSSTDDPFYLIRTIGEAKGLTYADGDAGTVSIGSPEWKAIFQSVVDGYKSGSVTMPGRGEDESHGGLRVMRRIGGGDVVSFGPDSIRFQSGQAAMAVDSSMLMDRMEDMGKQTGGSVRMTVPDSKDDKGGDAKKPVLKLFKSFEWDVVTIPTDPALPEVNGSLSLGNVLSISATSKNLSAAWELLKYANGEQLAKSSTQMGFGLPARTAHKKEVEGKNVDAFYTYGVNTQKMLQSLPSGFETEFAKLASDHIKKVVDGSETLDAALATLQTQGQDMLTKAATAEGAQ